jgi:hypothetical protein
MDRRKIVPDVCAPEELGRAEAWLLHLLTWKR